MKKDVMVTVIITAYNHEKYIEQAIQGILDQKTEYKYELVIHDDASTDGTQDIIRAYEKRYPDIVKAEIHPENLFRLGKLNTVIDYNEIAGKYVALCDGDDYWIDSKKLQKQVTFLEGNADYSMCIHNSEKFNCVTKQKNFLNTFPCSGTYDQRSQILAGIGTDFPASASYVMRTQLLRQMPAFFLKPRALDYSLRQYMASCGKVYYFEDVMSVYRVMSDTSYMKKTKRDMTFYNDYTVEMLNFFENFNEYTKRKYEDILQKKIDSDYFGFCSSIEESEGIAKAKKYNLDMDKINKCYSRLNISYLKSVKEVCTTSKDIYIYGTSRLALLCKRQMDYAGLKCSGFVVSDGQEKADTIDNTNVYWFKDIKNNHRDKIFILAVQPINLISIEKFLEINHVNEYYKPYIL